MRMHIVKKCPRQRQDVRRLLVALLLMVSVLLLTGCEDNSLKPIAQTAYTAAGSPTYVESIYVYHFHGLDDLNAQSGTTPAEAFGINTDQVPENGYVVIVNGNDNIYILMDENGAVVKSSNYTVLMNSVDNDRVSAWIKQVNADYAAGKMTDSELETQKQLIEEAANRNVVISKQCLGLSRYGVCVVFGSSESDKDEINTWHALTPSLIRSLQ